MKKYSRTVLLLIMVLTVMLAGVATTHAVEARYTGVTGLSATLNLSGNTASCSGSVIVLGGYTGDLLVELKRDGGTIASWSDSGSGRLSAGGTRAVISGHSYVVTATVTVYDGNGTLVNSYSEDSPTRNY